MNKLYQKVVILLFVVISPLSCAQQPTEKLEEVAPIKATDIKKLIGLSCNNNSQCKTIGFGDSPCGGYASHLIYSETDSQVEKLKQVVAQYNALDKANNIKNKVVGICRHISPPKTVCNDRKCVAVSNQQLELK